MLEANLLKQRVIDNSAPEYTCGLVPLWGWGVNDRALGVWLLEVSSLEKQFCKTKLFFVVVSVFCVFVSYLDIDIQHVCDDCTQYNQISARPRQQPTKKKYYLFFVLLPTIAFAI